MFLRAYCRKLDIAVTVWLIENYDHVSGNALWKRSKSNPLLLTGCLRLDRVEFALSSASVLPHGACVVGASQIKYWLWVVGVVRGTEYELSRKWRGPFSARIR